MQQKRDTRRINTVSVRAALVAFGANLTGPRGTPAEAVRWAMGQIGVPVQASQVYRTPAFPSGSGPDFANAVICFECDSCAEDLLARLHQIEAEAGRTRDRRWEARVLDLDLLALGSEVSPDPETWARWRNLDLTEQKTAIPDRLILPHPRLAERAFVLVPLAEVAPAWRHPVLGRTALELLQDLPTEDRAAVVPWEAD